MSQPSNQFSPPYHLIFDGLNEGTVIPFLGAGASLTWDSETEGENQEHLPSAAELANYLAKKVDFPKDETVDLAKVAQYYSLVGGRNPLNRTLHNIFNRNFSLTPLHTFLAGIEKRSCLCLASRVILISGASSRNRGFSIPILRTLAEIRGTS